MNAAEITFEHADTSLRLARFLGERDFDYVSVHGLKLSVGSPDRPPPDYLAALKEIAVENRAAAVSDHLGFTRGAADGVEIGHFAPVPYTEAALDATGRNVEYVQKYMAPMPFFLETIAYVFQFAGTMSEAEFLMLLLKRTGCGWLLDVTNVYANARNFGFDARQFIEEVIAVPQRIQMHLSGGFFDPQQKMYMDSHSRAIPDEVWDLYRYSLQLGGKKVEAVFIERDADYPDEEEWRREVRKARQIAESVDRDALAEAGK